MKDRILKGWTFTRGLYAVLGTVVVIQSAMQLQWFGILFGAYFASMGLFNFGCAAGNCVGGNCKVEPKNINSSDTQEVELEKLK